MKIKLSKSQWELVGRKAGWMKKAQSETSSAAIHNRYMLSKFNLQDRYSEFWDESYTPDVGIIDEIWVNEKQMQQYILLKDGSLIVDSSEFSGIIEDKNKAKIAWERKEFEEGSTFCSECGQFNPKIVENDLGIGNYEFWGSRGVHHDYQNGTECCHSKIEDKFGEEKSPEISEPELDEPDEINERDEPDEINERDESDESDEINDTNEID